MVTKAKKALLASLAAFLCVMLTVFGLSMSVSLSETAKAADETYGVDLTDYVVVGGIAGFEGKKFASFEEAYNAIKPTIEKLGLGQESASATDFDAIFTDRDENGNAKLTYTIKGNVVYDETSLSNLLTMGRRASHYGNDRHLIKFAFVGVTADKKDTLTVNSNITLPYEWWGEKVTTSISFENLTIKGSAPNGLYTYQPYFEGIDFTVNNCTLKGIKIYNCANVGGSYTITNSVLDGTGAAANAYAIHLQGNETAPLTINISSNTISGYDRGVNIDQTTANATISNNTISVKDAKRSCIQLTRLAETTIADNNLNLTGGNAITLHSNLAEGSKITVKANTIAGNGYLIYDDTQKAIDLTYGENTVAATVDKTKGVYGDTTKDLSGSVYNEVHHILAEVNGVKFATLAEAIAAAKDGETVKLLADVEQNSKVAINKNITLDLNGKKIYNTKDIWNETVSLIDIEGGAKVTVMGDGTIAAKKDDCYTINITDGDLTIENGTFVGNISVVQVVKGKLTINGGTFSLIQKMTDGKGADRYLINCIDAAFVANTAKVAIYGGSFAGFDPNVSPEAKVDGKVPSFAAPGVGITKNVDGSFTAKANMAAQILDSDGNSVAAYATLEEAVNAAVARKAIVMLLADTRENVTIAKMLTLELNGYTINGGTEKGKPAVTVTARVTIKDSSADQTGTIMREDTAENSGVSSHYVIDVQGDGWLTFEGGNVKNNSGVVGVRGASLVRVGDDSVAKYPGLNIKGGTFTQNNFIVIKIDRGDLFLNGGTLTSANSYAIENWKRATVRGGTVNGTVSSWTYSGGSNSELTISGGTINGDVTSVNYGNATDRKATVSVTGGIINGELDTRAYDPKTNKLTSIIDAAKATIEVSGGTFSTDPTKYVVEESAIIKNENGTYGVEKAYLAKVGDTSYYTMDEAFKAQTASGEAIVMLRDYTTGSTFNSGTKHRVVDLNRHTWTYTGTDTNSAAFEINNPNATLTVKNGTIISSTIVGLIPSAMGGTITYDNAGLVFDGVTMTSNGSSGIETNGNNTNDSVTLINSTLNVPDGFGIYFPSSGTLTINNSTITAKTMGVQVCSGELNINAGSAITVTGDSVPKAENDGAIQDGAAISIVNRTGYKGLSNIVITGGTFTAKAGNDAIKAYDWNNAENKGSDFTKADLVAVSGGTFSSEVKKDYLAKGYRLTKTGESYGVTAKYIESTHVSLGTALSFSYKLRTLEKGETIKNAKASYRTVRGNLVEINMTLVDGYYVFDGITPQMLDRKISVNVYVGDTVVYDVVDYSILDYLQDLLNTDLGTKATVTKQLVADLAFYGKAAMKYVGYTTAVVDEFIADNGLTQSTGDITGVATSSGTEKVANVSVQFASQNKILIGVAESVFKDYSYTIKVNGTKIDNELWQTDVVDGYRVYVSDGFAASYITDKDHYVEVEVLKNEVSVQKVQCNVAGYCMKMAENAKMGELAKATYYYGVSAAKYVAIIKG